MTFDFEGIECVWITARGPKFGRAAIFGEEEFVETVDLHHPTVEWQHEVAIDGLSDSSHTVRIVVLGERSANSRGKTVVCDGFSVP